MKHYYVRYGEFRNQYSLAWADTIKDGNRLKAAGFVPITRKEAENKARQECDRRAFDPNFSGYADMAVKPAPYYLDWREDFERDWNLYQQYEVRHYVWERK